MENKRFLYHGTGQDLFVIFLKNIFLTIVTLGIYTFWARTNVQKYNTSQMEWGGERFSFHGTGKERFIGFLKALVLIVIAFIIIFAIGKVLAFLPNPYLILVINNIITLSLLLGIIPFIVVGNRRFMTSRTGYRNLRFGFDGKVKEVAIIYFKGIFLSIITLGIYYPWFFAEKESYLVSQSRYGNVNIGMKLEGKELFFIYLKGIFLSIITLGIYVPWFMAEKQNYIWNHTSFQGHNFTSDITGLQILGYSVLAYILIFFTFGIGFAWAIAYMTKLFTETISLEAEIDFSEIIAKTDMGASATSEGLESISNALESFLG